MGIRKKLREGLLIEATTMRVKIPLPNNVKVLHNIFSENNFVLYLVGGAVRDFLLNKKIKDYDLVTDALPDQIEEILTTAGIKTLPTGKQFGIINAFVEGEEFEIATFREDSLTGDGRRPDSVTFSDIKTDVNRRDLTINALFYNLNTKEIIDYVGGIEDIKNRVVRTVGEPHKRFEEDKLRILRAIRFSVRTNTKLDSEIDKYLSNDYDLNGVSSERIRDEFLKSIQTAESVSQLMSLYWKYDMFRWILPDLYINSSFIDDNDVTITLAHLLINNDPVILGEKLNKLTYTINEIRDIRFLISVTKLLTVETAPELKRIQKNTTVSGVDIMKIGSLNGVNQNLLRGFNEYYLSVSGQAVMDKYEISGPEVGQKIEELEIEIFKKQLK